MTMKKEKIRQLAKWLHDNVDSHSIYDERLILEIGGGFTYDAKNGTLADNDDPEKLCILPLTSAAAQNRYMDNRGLGGTKVKEVEGGFLHFAGFDMAESIAEWVLGKNPGARFCGRGKAFRECVYALSQAAK